MRPITRRLLGSLVGIALVTTSTAPALASTSQRAQYDRTPKIQRERTLRRSYLSTTSLYSRYDTIVRLPETSASLTLRVQDGERLLKWTGEWTAVDPLGPHARLDAGNYKVVDGSGRERHFRVESGRPPVPRAARYALRPILFARRPTSEAATRFDEGVTAFYQALSARGPMVSLSLGSRVARSASAIHELEDLRQQGQLQRRVVKSTPSEVVADYFIDSEMSGRHVVGRAKLETPGGGSRTIEISQVLDDGTSTTHRLAWTIERERPGRDNSLSVMSSYGTHRERAVETTSGGVTTGRQGGPRGPISYRVDDHGVMVDYRHE